MRRRLARQGGGLALCLHAYANLQMQICRLRRFQGAVIISGSRAGRRTKKRVGPQELLRQGIAVSATTRKKGAEMAVGGREASTTRSQGANGVSASINLAAKQRPSSDCARRLIAGRPTELVVNAGKVLLELDVTIAAADSYRAAERAPRRTRCGQIACSVSNSRDRATRRLPRVDARDRPLTRTDRADRPAAGAQSQGARRQAVRLAPRLPREGADAHRAGRRTRPAQRSRINELAAQIAEGKGQRGVRRRVPARSARQPQRGRAESQRERPGTRQGRVARQASEAYRAHRRRRVATRSSHDRWRRHRSVAVDGHRAQG